MIVPFGFDIKENCIICASSLLHYQCILATMHSIEEQETSKEQMAAFVPLRM